MAPAHELAGIIMTQGQQTAFLILVLIHFVLSIIGTRVLLKTAILTRLQKRLNLILLWTLPVIWYLFVKTIYKKTPGSHEVPVKNDVSSNNSYESGIGAPGAGIGNRGQ